MWRDIGVGELVGTVGVHGGWSPTPAERGIPPRRPFHAARSHPTTSPHPSRHAPPLRTRPPPPPQHQPQPFPLRPPTQRPAGQAPPLPRRVRGGQGNASRAGQCGSDRAMRVGQDNAGRLTIARCAVRIAIPSGSASFHSLPLRTVVRWGGVRSWGGTSESANLQRRSEGTEGCRRLRLSAASPPEGFARPRVPTPRPHPTPSGTRPNYDPPQRRRNINRNLLRSSSTNNPPTSSNSLSNPSNAATTPPHSSNRSRNS